MKWRRTFGFAAVYLSLYLSHSLLFSVGTYIETREGVWHLQHPLEALNIVIFELGHTPLLVANFLLIVLYALTLGFATDLVYDFLVRRIKLRKQRMFA